MGTIEGINWEAEQRRFTGVAYPRTLEAAKKAFRGWHSRRDDAVAECLAKMWDQWKRLLDRGKDPEPMFKGLVKYAILWVRYDRRIAGRARSFDVFDYRANMRRQQLDGQGHASPTDRSDPGNGRIDWAVRTGDDPVSWAAAMEEAGLTSTELYE